MPEKPSVATICLQCGKEFLTYRTSLKKGLGKFCSHTCSNVYLKIGTKTGPESAGWKGGRYVAEDGYSRIHVEGNRYILEHRLIMEQHLGRMLSPDECIHHINGDKSDNRIENLKLTNQSEHARTHHNQRRGGLWAEGHAACVHCGRTDRKHAGKGLCRVCYVNHRKDY